VNLTTKQNEIVRFIWVYRRAHGIAPTLSEIAGALGVSKITVHEHIGLLEKKGAIKKEKYQSRSLTLNRGVVKELESVERERARLGLRDKASVLKARTARTARSRRPVSPEAPTLPLLGKIAAGVPIEAIEDSSEIDIATVLRLDRASYALRVRGDSMVDDGIHDGDYVLVERRATPRDGETVVAILENNEATLKRFYRDASSGGYRLVPANTRLHPILVPKNKLEIRGVVVGQLRHY
jgi:repressor LexA